MPFEIPRIKWSPPNAFAEVNSKKAAPRGCGEDFIDFSMGNPDTTPATQNLDKLVETASDPNTYRYSNSHGLPELHLANVKVAVAPLVGFGEYGDGFVWFVLVENEYRIRQAIFGIGRFLQDYRFLEITDSHAVVGQ